DMFVREGCEDDILHWRSSASDPVERPHEGMGRGDLVVPIRADQQQMPHSGLGQQMFEQIERGRVEPLQIIEEQSKGMLGASEHCQETPEDQEKTSLRVLGRQFREWLLLADDEFQVRDQVHHKLAMWPQGFTERLTPVSEFDVAFRQKRTDEPLK